MPRTSFCSWHKLETVISFKSFYKIFFLYALERVSVKRSASCKPWLAPSEFFLILCFMRDKRQANERTAKSAARGRATAL